MIGVLLSIALVLPPTTASCDEAKIKQMVRDSVVVLVAEVKEVETPSLTASWSGLAIFKQHVLYKVRAILKGEITEREVRVGYSVYKNSLTADKNRPQLSPVLFKKNTVHIVFLKLEEKSAVDGANQPTTPSYLALDVNCGAILDTPAVEAEIRAMPSTP